jgi:hypothetical protein
MEWVLTGGLIIWIVLIYIQVSYLEHQNSLLRQEITELYRLLSYRNGIGGPVYNPGCAGIVLLLLFVAVIIYVSLSG